MCSWRVGDVRTSFREEMVWSSGLKERNQRAMMDEKRFTQICMELVLCLMRGGKGVLHHLVNDAGCDAHLV